jgi:hypothetical protein
MIFKEIRAINAYARKGKAVIFITIFIKYNGMQI